MVFILQHLIWYSYCNSWHGIYIGNFYMVFILQNLTWYLYWKIWHGIYIATVGMVFVLLHLTCYSYCNIWHGIYIVIFDILVFDIIFIVLHLTQYLYFNIWHKLINNEIFDMITNYYIRHDISIGNITRTWIYIATFIMILKL